MEEGFESEDYRAWDKAKQQKRAKNREDSAQMLRDAGVQFLENNNGAHLIVTVGEHVFDFFLRNKRAEWDEYARQVTEFERMKYLPVL